MTDTPFDIIKRAITYAKALYSDDLVQQTAYATGYVAAMNHTINEKKKEHIYRTVARIESLAGGKCYIVISAIDPRAQFVVNYNDLIYAMGVPLLSRHDRFMINIDIGLENHDVVGFKIADRDVYVGAEWHE